MFVGAGLPGGGSVYGWLLGVAAAPGSLGSPQRTQRTRRLPTRDARSSADLCFLLSETLLKIVKKTLGTLYLK